MKRSIITDLMNHILNRHSEAADQEPAIFFEKTSVWLITPGFIAIFLALSFLSYPLVVEGDPFLWPPMGFAVAAGLLVGPKIYPGLFIVSCLFMSILVFNDFFLMEAVLEDRHFTAKLAYALVISLGSLLQIAITVYLLRRDAAIATLFHESRDVFRFISASVIGVSIGGVINRVTSIVYFQDFGNWAGLLLPFFTWMVNNLVAVLVFVPMIISWSIQPGYQTQWQRSRIIELTILTSLVVFAGVVFFMPVFDRSFFNSHAIFMIPVLIWTAYRFPIRQSLLLAFILVVFATAGTMQGIGPFTVDSTVTTNTYAQLFVGISMLGTLMISTNRSENERIKEDLQVLNTGLEERVGERTLKLQQQVKNTLLLSDIAGAANVPQPAEDILRRTLSEICVYTKSIAGVIYFVHVNENDDGLNISLEAFQHSYGKTERLGLAGNDQKINIDDYVDTIPALVYSEGTIIWKNLQQLPPAKMYLQAKLLNVASIFAVPIKVSETTVAIIECYSELSARQQNNYSNTLAQAGVILGRVLERKLAQDERDTLNNELVNVSRQAGMSEVASGVLHNVGNVLNSVNVSANMAIDTLRKSSLRGLHKAISMAKDHHNELVTFLTEDTKGSQLFSYLDKLNNKLKIEKQQIESELSALQGDVEHIKVIVQRQQSYAKTNHTDEPVDPNQLFEDALQMNAPQLKRYDIDLHCQLTEVQKCYLDRHNVLQILGNLISNAKHALEPIYEGVKQLKLETRLVDDYFYFIVQDNGVGITEEAQDHIFEHGFTTKQGGHGFGLHASANAAQKMDGELWFKNNPSGAGVSFILKVPYRAAQQSHMPQRAAS